MKKYILILFLSITITLNAQVCLNVPVTLQEQTEWCWAAASKCMLEYYGKVYWQCEIAEYVRKNDTYHNLGSIDCCVDPLQGCNQGISFSGGTGSIEDILVEFGPIPNNPTEHLDLGGIVFHLNLQHPIIMRWQNLSDPTHGHAMVIYGINGNMIDYMDPDFGYLDLPYNSLLNNGVWKWAQTIYPTVSPFIISDHCKNCIWDAEKGEEAMDCGGPCPPCEHSPDKVIINTPTNNLPTVVRAVEKITAGNAAVKVLPGQNVTFQTAGTIELLPGFEAQAGSVFKSEAKGNIFEVTADCNEFCSPYVYFFWLHRGTYCIDNVANVDKIYYEVYTPDPIFLGWYNPLFVYSETVYIYQDGRVALWDMISGENISGHFKPGATNEYVIEMTYYTCQGYIYSSWARFFVTNLAKNKSSNTDSESEEHNFLSPFSSPNTNNTPLQSTTALPALSIIPNPNPGVFQLETNFPLSDIAHLKVANTLGISVYETKNLTSNTIQLQDAASGMFFVVVILKDGNVLTQKMMVQR